MANYRLATGYTARAAHDAMITVIEELFEGMTFTSPVGRRSDDDDLPAQTGQRELKVYGQMMPIQTIDDELADSIESLAPAIQVRIDSGEVKAAERQMQVTLALVVCTWDNGTDREGLHEVYNIVQRITGRFMSDPIFGAFEAQYPIDWAIQQEETPPYYYGAVSIPVALPIVAIAPTDKKLEELL